MIAAKIADWLRYALQTLLYGFTYQVGQNLAEGHGKTEAKGLKGDWSAVLAAVIWATVVLALLAEIAKRGNP